MLIGIISDTHGYLSAEIPDILEGVDLILHAGDIGDPGILTSLESIAPTRAVWGNIDGMEIRRRTPEHQRFQVEGVSFWMTHIGGRPGRWEPGIRRELEASRPDVFICGHSHILRIERVSALNGMLYLNPGAAGRQGFHRVKTCVRLVVEDGAAREAEVVHLEE